VEVGAVTVTVHNIGGSASPASAVEVRGANAEVLGRATVPGLQPPHDLQPKIVQVRIRLKPGAKPARVLVDPAGDVAEITQANNSVRAR